MANVMMSFNNQEIATHFLTEDEIRNKCPLAFADSPTNNNVTEKYVLANTFTVIQDMERLGWRVVDAKQRKAHKDSSGRFSFHMVCFQNPEIKITKTSEDGDEIIDCFPRIILTSSHDGCNSFKLMVGLFRLVCSNGLVVCSESFGEVSIRHINYTFDDLRTAIQSFVEALPAKVGTMNNMKNKILTDDEKKSFARMAYLIRMERKEDDPSPELNDDVYAQLLMPVRSDDRGSDLWTVFNVVQEKLTKGGIKVQVPGKKERKLRSVSSFVRDLDLNKGLWKLAESYMSIPA